jgi:uncharacterized protein DUF4255/carboxypeptidase family protein
MIRDLSATLEDVLTDPVLTADFPELAAATVVFDRPTDTFSPLFTAIDLFLFDIRENLELRSSEPRLERRGTEAVLRPAPRRIDCSYLVTAWPSGGADLALQEHRLLSQVLQLLSRIPTIPPALLQGSLIGQTPPLPLIVPQFDGLKSPAEFWTAMGSKLRASLTVTVTISVPYAPEVTGPVVTTLRNRFGGRGPEGPVDEERIAIGGRVLNAGSVPPGAPVAGAVVDVLDAGLRTTTDALGQYRFERVPAGTRTVRAVAVGFQPSTRAFDVPGPAETYDFTLTPNP